MRCFTFTAGKGWGHGFRVEALAKEESQTPAGRTATTAVAHFHLALCSKVIANMSCVRGSHKVIVVMPALHTPAFWPYRAMYPAPESLKPKM